MSSAGCACNPGGVPSGPEPSCGPRLALGGSWPSCFLGGEELRSLPGRFCGAGLGQTGGFLCRLLQWCVGEGLVGCDLQLHRSGGTHRPPAVRLSGNWSGPHIPEQTPHHMVKHCLYQERHIRSAESRLPSLMRSLLSETPASTALWYTEGVSATCMCTWVMCDGELWLSPEISPSPTVAGRRGCSEELPSPEEFLTKDWQLERMVRLYGVS
ncbi:uncharacterized protein LOC115339418 [Aquila chrysaetos chrysaetos]|uniref:uncharacterized protein LOC115339418 n=1 Tax=Aquila chrysaetos chrysaetos TaxID=223781 RepID=UPI001176CD91|nr:uncharacterized protein LOC115339418 [Aquila chrysaetos chrysaetos]XP_040978218.1 uncharacterized protein LOC115339418 [Aquila chrysaetos chrysaetos]